MNLTNVIFTVQNGQIYFGCLNNQSVNYIPYTVIKGTSEVVKDIVRLTQYAIQGTFTMHDVSTGEFTTNLMLSAGVLNIVAQKDGNKYNYYVRTNKFGNVMNREECLRFINTWIANCDEHNPNIAKATRMKINALIDVDCTLVDFHAACAKYLAERGYTYRPDKLLDYHGFNSPDIGVDWNLLRQVMQTPTMYLGEYLQKYDGVDKGLQILRQKGIATNGYTGAENNEQIYRMRFNFCKANKLIPNVFIGSKPVISGFNVLFDDNPYVIDNWLNNKDTGHMKFYMIEQPYNTHIDLTEGQWRRVTRVKSFYHGVLDLVKLIEKR